MRGTWNQTLLLGKTFKFRDEEDLWLMNRKVSINQVVVEVNYVCGVG